jgi:hypothetical protein
MTDGAEGLRILKAVQRSMDDYGSKIQNNVSVYKGVTLEEGVFCGISADSTLTTGVFPTTGPIGFWR